MPLPASIILLFYSSPPFQQTAYIDVIAFVAHMMKNAYSYTISNNMIRMNEFKVPSESFTTQMYFTRKTR